MTLAEAKQLHADARKQYRRALGRFSDFVMAEQARRAQPRRPDPPNLEELPDICAQPILSGFVIIERLTCHDTRPQELGNFPYP